jgi:DNA polymerase-3 subunit alpha
MEKFAGYGFNKSHSAAYAVVSYQTGYLKAYYPVEFMAALLSTEMRDQDNVVRYIQSAREHGIAILPPCVNRSDRDFSVVPYDNGQHAILFGLGAVKGIGDSAIEAICAARKDQPFGSLYGFCEHVDLKKVNRKVLDALIKSGAGDTFQRPRSQLLAVIEKALDAGQKANRDRAHGQTSLFAAFAGKKAAGTVSHSSVIEFYPDEPEWDKRQRLAFEKEALGFYITGHPLDDYSDDLPRLCNVNTSTLASVATKGQRFGAEVAVGGVISAMRERPLKNGTGRMAFLTLEDLHGTCEVIVFSKVYNECETIIKSDEPILVRGTAVVEGDEEDGAGLPKIRAIAIERLADARTDRARGLDMTLPVSLLNEQRLGQLRDLLKAHKGAVPVRVTITDGLRFAAELALPEHLTVHPSDGLLLQLERLFGQRVVRLH